LSYPDIILIRAMAPPDLQEDRMHKPGNQASGVSSLPLVGGGQTAQIRKSLAEDKLMNEKI
jgi:hypothetical protein